MSDRIKVNKTSKLYIGGKFVRSESGRYYKTDAGKEPVNICLGSRKDFRNAVVSARKAFSGWSGKSAYNRGQILYRIAEMLEARKAQFAAELVDSGASQRKANDEVDQAIDRLIYFAGWADKYQQVFSTVNPVASAHFNFSVPEPTGVVAIIAPNENPLLSMITLIAPVIVGGNTCVILAPEQTPLPATSFAEVINSSDVPGGVVNILTGKEQELKEHISSHMDVNAVFYSGSNLETENIIQEKASLNVKRVKLTDSKNWMDGSRENPYIILDFQEIKTTWHPVGL